MNRIALSIALALGIAAGVSTSALADGPELRAVAPSWFEAAPEGGVVRLAGDVAGGEGGTIVVRGRRSYSEERAFGDARLQLEQAVAEWLSPEIPTSWVPPTHLVDGLILEHHVEPVPIDRRRLGLDDDADLSLPETLHVAALRADLSEHRRSAFVEARDRQIGARRLSALGGLAGFVLTCLAILALYIRADEATRGYYTNRLRAIAVASAGAAGVVLYRLLV